MAERCRHLGPGHVEEASPYRGLFPSGEAGAAAVDPGRARGRLPATSGKPIIGLKPNRLPDDRPKTEALLHVFRYVTVTQVILAEHPAEIVISPLNLLQTHVLELMGLEGSIHTLEYLRRPLDKSDSY
jgi:hypothetical protein